LLASHFSAPFRVLKSRLCVKVIAVYVPSLFFVIPLDSVSLFPRSRVFIVSFQSFERREKREERRAVEAYPGFEIKWLSLFPEHRFEFCE
jgi:hypothetical protein